MIYNKKLNLFFIIFVAFLLLYIYFNNKNNSINKKITQQKFDSLKFQILNKNELINMLEIDLMKSKENVSKLENELIIFKNKNYEKVKFIDSYSSDSLFNFFSKK